MSIPGHSILSIIIFPEIKLFWALKKKLMKFHEIYKTWKFSIIRLANIPYVTVLGYPPPPSWSLSDSRQARQGLDTNVTLFHNSFNVLQMVAPGAAIWLHLATGG